MISSELQARLKNLAYRIVTLRIAKITENQILRAAFTAPANYRASCKAISSKAFVSKLGIAF